MNTFTQQLIDAFERAGIKHRSYSGRGMFGVNCVAVAVRQDGPSEQEVLEAVSDVPGGLGPSRDALGQGAILYWPRARLTREEV